MDMMHSLVFAVPPKPPTLLTATAGTAPTRVDLTWTDNSIKEVGFTVQRASNAGFTTGLRTFNVPANAVTFTDTTVANNAAYWYKVFAIGEIVGDVFNYPESPLDFPTMSADSVSNTLGPVNVGTPTGDVPADPTLLVATVQAGPRVRLVWRDNATNETGFEVERCRVVAPATTCGNGDFAVIATTAARTGVGNVPAYFDTAVTAGNTYFYRVFAVNAIGQRSVNPAGPTSAPIPAVPAAPTNFRVSVVKNATGPNYTATLTWQAVTNPTNFTIQRARNSTFTTGLNTTTPGAAVRSVTQTLAPNTTFYFRIRANSNISGSSAWTNALPFPIRTGP
jgi:titin